VKETQEAFQARRRSDWDELLDLLSREKSLHRLEAPLIERAGMLYRNTASDLMRARAAGYTPDLIRELDQLAARAHAALYAAPPYRLGAITELLLQDFPATLRKHARVFWLATALFVFPALLGFFAALSSRYVAMQILPEQMIASAEQMYADGFSGRDEAQDATMAGFYIQNNVGIAFRCFATGILLGLGSVFFLVYNGLVIGTFMGLVTAAGHGMNLLEFTSGHGAFELTAIVISGAAGIVMGYALVDTKGLTRIASLRLHAKDIANLILGAAVMLIIAAFVEGFWSPSSAPRPVKLVVAACFWLSVIAYLTWVGRAKQVERNAETAS